MIATPFIAPLFWQQYRAVLERTVTYGEVGLLRRSSSTRSLLDWYEVTRQFPNAASCQNKVVVTACGISLALYTTHS